jgi:heptosyltransferase II
LPKVALSIISNLYIGAQMNIRNANNILIIQTAFIGDVILTTPLIRETKRAFPEAHIDVLVIPETKNVLNNNPHIRSILVFDKRSKKIRTFFKMVWMIYKSKYDFAFAAHRSMTTAWLMILGGTKIRIGFTGKAAARLMSDPITFRQSARQVERYLDLLRPMTYRPLEAQSELFFSPEIEQRSRHLLSVLDPQKPKIIIAPGSVRATKRWPEERFTELLKKLGRIDINIILMGSPGEKILCDKIERDSSVNGVLNLAGKTSLLEAAAVIKKSDLLVCNDSGTMHMANAVSTDVFAFFGPTVEWFGFSPFRPNDKVFQVDVDCRPCGTHGGKACPKGHFKCMLDIEVEQVYQAIVKKLDM